MTTSMTTADVTTEVEALAFMFQLCQTSPRQVTGVMFFLILRCRLLQLLPNQKSPILCPQLSDVTNAVISQSPASSLSAIFISHKRSHLPVTTNFIFISHLYQSRTQSSPSSHHQLQKPPTLSYDSVSNFSVILILKLYQCYIPQMLRRFIVVLCF